MKDANAVALGRKGGKAAKEPVRKQAMSFNPNASNVAMFIGLYALLKA